MMLQNKKIYGGVCILIALIGAISLSIESVLALKGKSLCQTTACTAVANFLKINESLLIAGGAIFFWLLFGCLFFSIKYPKKLRLLPLIILGAAVSFDASIIGFQFFSIQKYCVICIAVALSLLFTVVFYCLYTKDFFIIVLFFCLWIGAFISHALIRLPPPQSASSQMTFYTIEERNSSATKQVQKTTLIFSLNCSHCLHVVDRLANTYPIDFPLNLVSIDQDRASLAKLSHFVEKANTQENPFDFLLELKKNESTPPSIVNREIIKMNKNGLNYLSNLGIKNIPVLIQDIDSNHKNVIIGSNNILSALDSSK